ncbi:competence protein CoiA [Bacillus carboniphilus]
MFAERAKRQGIYYCPGCKQNVQLKKGSNRLPHFAHYKNNICTYTQEGESQQHLKGKYILYHYFKKQKKQIQLEPYFQQIKQRPDLFLVDERLVIEYQCSVIPTKLIKRRSKGYEEMTYKSIWIIGSHLINRLGTYQYRLTPFHWTMINDFPATSSSSLYFLDSTSLITLHNLIPFSKQNVFALSSRQSLTNDRRWNLKKEALFENWWKKVQKNRLKPIRHLSRKERELQSYLYENFQLSYNCLPSEAYLPLSSGWMVDESVYLWQSWLLMMIKEEVDPLFRVEKLLWKLNALTIHFRKPPKEAVLEYLCHLQYLKIIDKVGSNIYKKRNPIIISNDLAKSLKRDEQLMDFYRKNKFT